MKIARHWTGLNAQACHRHFPHFAFIALLGKYNSLGKAGNSSHPQKKGEEFEIPA